jgi:hypothetical protein
MQPENIWISKDLKFVAVVRIVKTRTQWYCFKVQRYGFRKVFNFSIAVLLVHE